MATERYKTESCSVLSYNRISGDLDIDFQGFGIRIKNVQKDIQAQDIVSVVYRGKIGASNFQIKVK